MLRWALILLIIALAAALFGFTGIAAAAAGIAQILVLPVPGGLPHVFCYRHIGRQEGSVGGSKIKSGWGETGRREVHDKILRSPRSRVPHFHVGMEIG